MQSITGQVLRSVISGKTAATDGRGAFLPADNFGSIVRWKSGLSGGRDSAFQHMVYLKKKFRH